MGRWGNGPEPGRERRCNRRLGPGGGHTGQWVRNRRPRRGDMAHFQYPQRASPRRKLANQYTKEAGPGVPHVRTSRDVTATPHIGAQSEQRSSGWHTPRQITPPARLSLPSSPCGRLPIAGSVLEVLQGTSTGIHQSVNSSTSSAHSTQWRHARCTHSAEPSIIDIISPTHIKSLTTTTHSSPHLCTYLQVRFPPLYAEVDALLGCWSMVAVCQERPWTPAVHTDRNVQRGARARNERGRTITKHLQHPTCMTRDKLTHTHKNMLISPIPQSRPAPYHPTTTPTTTHTHVPR